jgi:MscS family membrane protein
MRRDYALVELNEYGESGLIVLLYCFMDAQDWATELSTRTALNLEILKLAADLGVSFALPTRTLHLDKAPRPLDDAQLAAIVRRYERGGVEEVRTIL